MSGGVMTERDTDREATPPQPMGRASYWQVVRDQKKTIYVAIGLSVAAYWILGQLGEWTLAACLAAGVGLGLLNHLATEYWLLRLITSGEEATRQRLAVSTMTRLVVISVVAVAIAVWWWPDGIGVFFGLAVFRLIAIVMTTAPLLKELKKQ
jgi:hypothetical protein